MSLPVRLAYGEIAIYGINDPGITGLVPPSGFNFGYVNQLSPYGISYTSVYQSVLFKGTDVICKLAYDNGIYSVIKETAIIATETPLL